MTVSEFKPAWWLPGPHLQTLWPAVARRRKQLTFTRERLELSDGDFIDLDWTAHREGPIVLVLHGLEGSANSPYAQGIAKTLHASGLRSVVVHFRSCSGEVNRLPRMYHSGDTADLATVVSILRARERNVPIAAIGFSLGGNVLLKWLGETGQHNLLAAAVAVSVPFQLDKSVDHLQAGFARLYKNYLLRSLRRKVTAKFALHEAPIDLPHLPSLQSLRQFDEAITAPLHGFLNAADYYKKSSSRQFLKTIHVPTLLLQAEDDPFMPQEVIPRLTELSRAITLEVSARGGHVGFVSGIVPWRPRYWLEERIPEFLKQYL